MIPLLFGLAGTAAGAAEAGLLARTAAGRSNPLSFPLRLLLVAAVLVVAARTGHLLAGVAGWGIGFVVGATVAYRRLG